MRYLGIDFGSQKVGLALSDEAGKMGFPHAIVPNSPKLVEELADLIDKEKVEAIVVGESKDFAGNDNPIAAEAHLFAEALAHAAGKPIHFEPEMLTSAQARRQHDPSEKTREVKSTAPIDDSAAALILTSYLSRHGNAR